MRTVVGEQITALSRLNSLISKYDESNDVLKPEKIIDNTKVIVNNKYSKDEVNENEINYKSYNWILPELLAPTSRNNEKKLTSDNNKIFEAETVIVATGAPARWLGLDSEKKFNGKGVSACATCDGFFYKNKEVAVIGGGNTAVEEALYLTNFASSVTLIHRRDTLKCEKILENRLMSNKKINIIWDSVLEEVIGSSNPYSVTGARIRNIKTNENYQVKIDGIFIAIGHKPSTELFVNQIDMKESGYIITEPDSTATNIPGVYAAGDVTDDIYSQAVTAAVMGCMAALEAEHYLSNKK
jgi:thioredoxin reductase (NADPH)